MAIERLLGTISVCEFLDRFFQKVPLAMRETAQCYCDLGDWNLLHGLLKQRDADVLAAKKGEPFHGARPTSEGEARSLHAEGYTLLVRHAERHDPRLAKIAEDFFADFCFDVDLHVYYTPSEQHGFGWHYDAEDVFILQTAGAKRYSLRKNTVNPWPTMETLPENMGYEHEVMPILQCNLNAGDWLYIPAGYWHVATTGSEESISISVGLRPRTAIDVVDAVRRRLATSLFWRQRLPVTGVASDASGEELREQYRSLLQALAEQFQRELLEESLLDELMLRPAG